MIKSTFSKTFQNSSNPDSYHSQCVCQICTCHKHKCPHSKVTKMELPFIDAHSYRWHFDIPEGVYRTPFNAMRKKAGITYLLYLTIALEPRAHQPYGYINSSYRENYPGHKPEMRQKIIPRVKNENRNIPLEGESMYKTAFGPKTVFKEKPRNKDREFNPDNQPFEGKSIYKSDFFPKKSMSQPKRQSENCAFPPGYKFQGSTTYCNDFLEKPLTTSKSFKPIEKPPAKGTHDLTSLYQQEYSQKPLQPICPVKSLPEYPKVINYPKQHVTYNKYKANWIAK